MFDANNVKILENSQKNMHGTFLANIYIETFMFKSFVCVNEVQTLLRQML